MFFCVSTTFVCKDEPGHNHVNVGGGDDGDELALELGLNLFAFTCLHSLVSTGASSHGWM